MDYLVQEFQQPFPSIKFKPLTEKEIYEINKSLKWKNSCCYDEVPSKIVKLSMQFILSPWIQNSCSYDEVPSNIVKLSM
jgi:hypothetical protein